MTKGEKRERECGISQGSRRRSRRKIAVADDTGAKKGREGERRDVKNGGVPNECQPARERLKTRKKVRGGEPRGKSHMSTSRISVEIIAPLRDVLIFRLSLSCIKLSSKVDRFLVSSTFKPVLRTSTISLYHLFDYQLSRAF